MDPAQSGAEGGTDAGAESGAEGGADDGGDAGTASDAVSGDGSSPAVAPPLPTQAPMFIRDQGKDVDSWTVSAENCEAGLVLQAFARANDVSVVLSPGAMAAGKISFRVFKVPFKEAFNSILKATDLVEVDLGSSVKLIKTSAEVQKEKVAADKEAQSAFDRQDAKNKAEQDRIAAEAAASVIRTQRAFTLNFLSATDAETFIKPMLTPETGSVATLGTVAPGYDATMTDGGADNFAFAATVMVYDTSDKLDQVEKLLKELDTPPQQVRVEATILTANLTDDTAFGMDISVVGNIDFADVAAPLLAFDNVLSGAVKPDTPATANEVGLYPKAKGQPNPTAKFGVVTNDVAIFLQMLDQVVDTTVMARPTVTVLNRQRANVLVGERIAYLSTTQTDTSTTQEVKYLDVGVKLRFRPFVSPDGMIRIELAPEVSSARIKDIEAAGGGRATVPDELTQSLKTNVRVKSGQTIVLGGLFREVTDTTNRQIPILGDLIPGAFSGASSQVTKQEIIFLITPTIVEDAQSYEAGLDKLKVVDAAKVGIRAGLLPFSQTHLNGAYQVQAMEAWKKGDRSTALYYVDQALRSDPGSMNMIQLREAIRTDDKEGWQSELDSLLMLIPSIREDNGAKPPPTLEQMSQDIPPPVDDDFTRVPPMPQAKAR